MVLEKLVMHMENKNIKDRTFKKKLSQRISSKYFYKGEVL